MSNGRILHDNWRGGPNGLAKELSTIAAMINGMRGTNGVNVFKSPTGIVVQGSPGGGSGLDLGLFAFGLVSINASTSKATVNGGHVVHGLNEYEVDDNDEVGVSPGCYITLKYIRGSSAEFVSPSPTSRLISSPSAVYIPLYKLSSATVLERVLHVGDIHIFGEAP